ncbi:MAG: proton-conducting transporter membrane subunit, partial [Acidimicrobiaceae bacterium]
ANSTLLTEIGAKITATGDFSAVHALAVVFVVVGFAFKVSAVPFHTCAPDTYEGAPTPVTAFLSVASKAAGFVALVVLLYTAFPLAQDIWQPFIWVLSALTMTVGNVLALKQHNIVRMIAYSSISQGGFVLMPLAVAGLAGSGTTALRSVVLYMIVYAA